MKKILSDILRDTGSSKFSITKSLALLFSVFLLVYLTYIGVYLKNGIDHTLVIEIIGLIGALVGLKNSWGMKKNVEVFEKKKVVSEISVTSEDSDEGVF